MVERVKLKPGPVSQYNPKLFPKQAKLLAQRGATQAELAECFGVSTRTLQNWLVQYPELQNAFDVGCDVFNPRVERALAERALGFYMDEFAWRETTKAQRDKGADHFELIPVARRYYPPDVTAGIYFTKNRMPDRWRDVQRLDVKQTHLQSSEELQKLLALEFKDLIDQGLLRLPSPERMKEINPKGNGRD